jgi:hypothetical protein
VGLLVLGFGGLCESCEPPMTDLHIGHSPSSRAVSEVLAEAAAALRMDAWQAAAAALSELPPIARRAPVARRLLAGTLVRAVQALLDRLSARAGENRARALGALSGQEGP